MCPSDTFHVINSVACLYKPHVFIHNSWRPCSLDLKAVNSSLVHGLCLFGLWILSLRNSPLSQGEAKAETVGSGFPNCKFAIHPFLAHWELGQKTRGECGSPTPSLLSIGQLSWVCTGRNMCITPRGLCLSASCTWTRLKQVVAKGDIHTYCSVGDYCT